MPHDLELAALYTSDGIIACWFLTGCELAAGERASREPRAARRCRCKYNTSILMVAVKIDAQQEEKPSRFVVAVAP
jgi:uncharacterized ParB-like nuclease family protein